MIFVFFEILLIIILLLALFGSKKFPQMMKNLAEGVKVFKEGLKATDSKKAPVKKSAVKKSAIKKSAKNNM